MDVSGSLSVSEWLFEHGTTPGTLKMSLAGAYQPTAGGSLVNLTFSAVSADAIKQLRIAEFKLNGGWIKSNIRNLPRSFVLLQNYPNPFNPETWIPYQLSMPADVSITVYSTSGHMVRQLEIGYRLPGYYTDKAKAAYWDGRNQSGEWVSSGIYFYKLQAGQNASVGKMTVVK
jgi:hypothetical protein